MNEIEKLNMCCMWLIVRAAETKAEEMKVTQENVTHGEEKLGTWEISVKKVS